MLIAQAQCVTSNLLEAALLSIQGLASHLGSEGASPNIVERQFVIMEPGSPTNGPVFSLCLLV